MNDGKSQAFRFFDNREKYLLFVTTCSEKWAIAERAGRELDGIVPRPPSFNLFDAGMGDATVLTRVMRDMHRRHPTVPFFVVGKEISLEDVRLSLDKLPDRFAEHPQTVVAITNLYYREAPWLMPQSAEARQSLNWNVVALKGDNAHAFADQIQDLQQILVDGWQTRTSTKTGNPLYVRPSVLVLYRDDQRFLLDRLIPQKGNLIDGYDLVIASQPYRARSPAAIKVRNVLGPLATCLKEGGRMLVVQSTGHDPGMEIIRKVWPDENPFQTPRHTLIEGLRDYLGTHDPGVTELRQSEEHTLFRFHLHSLPDELSDNIGTSTLLAAWNAAIYVAQIEDDRLTEVLRTGEYLEATKSVLNAYGELWFLDESFVFTRRQTTERQM